MRQPYAGDDPTPGRDRRGLRKQLQGLQWWQAVLVLLPLGLIGVGGALGGGIGGAAAVANLSLARRPMAAAAKFLAMAGLCAVAFVVFFLLEYGIRSALAPSSSSATGAPDSPTTATSPFVASTAAQPTPAELATCTAKTWAPEPVAMNTPTVIHATGAELSWPAYVNITCNPANDLVAYEIHRGTNPNFTPSAATLVATVKAQDTSFVDRTASPSTSPHARDYVYMVAVRTKSGQVIAGSTRSVQLPEPGQTELVLPTDQAATLNARYPDTVVDSSGFSLTVSPDIGGEGAERAIFEFGSLKAIPRGAVVADARLSLACGGTNSAPISVYGLTRTFDSSTATWNSAASGVKWTHPGGDYTAPSGTSMLMDTADPQMCEFDATAIVRGWTGSRGAEHGLLLRFNDESSARGYGAFDAGDTYFPEHRPALVVTYESGG
jgi:hypothetical protein